MRFAMGVVMVLRLARSVATVVSLVSLATLVGCASAATEDDSVDNSYGATATDALTAEALSANENTAYAFFVNKGLSSVQAAGIVGNLIQESTVLPSATEPGGPGRGIAQWSSGGRWNSTSHDNVAWYAAQHGMSTSSLTTQLDFIWYELQNFSAYGLGRLRSASTVSSAVVAFETDYEACGACSQSRRISFAEEVLSHHGSVSSGSSGSGAEEPTSGNGNGTVIGSTTGSSTGSSASGCYSGTLGENVSANACVQNRANRAWYQCDNGSWVDRASDPEACSSQHAL